METQDRTAAATNSLDQEMVAKCLRGSEHAWEDFVRAHAGRIYALSYRFTRSRAEAEDLTQDVFIRVYQTLRSYRGDYGNLSGWIHHVARNLLIDRYRRTRRHVRFDPIRQNVSCVRDSRLVDPLQHLAQDEIAVMVHAALGRLVPEVRIVIVLHDLEALALSDVAALLDVPLGTVKSRMVRGRRELARILHNRSTAAYDYGAAKAAPQTIEIPNRTSGLQKERWVPSRPAALVPCF